MVFTLNLTLIALLADSPASDPRAQAADQGLRQGNDALRAGLIDDAIREYRKAYDLFPTPKLLYNLAQAYAIAGRTEEARDAFGRFMAEVQPYAAGDPQIAAWIENSRDWMAALDNGVKPRPVPLVIAAKSPPTKSDSSALVSRVPPPPQAGKRGHGLWWIVALGAAASAVVVVLAASRSGHRNDCPPAADIGCL
jgi:tetratricopeptide (TPR) repeat protein